MPVYPTLPAHQIEYILRDSGAVAVCVSPAAQLEKILEIRGDLPALGTSSSSTASAATGARITFEAVVARGTRGARQVPRRGEPTRWPCAPDDLATLIYTSGTTGDPKGVMLTHGNITSNVVAGLQVLDLRHE